MTGNQKQNSIPCRLKNRVSPFGVCSGRCAATIPLRHAACQLRTAVGQHGLVGYKVIPPLLPKSLDGGQACPVWEVEEELRIPV